MQRRLFLKSAGVVCLAPGSTLAAEVEGEKPFIGTNVYPWMTFYKREQRAWADDIETGLQAVASTGVQGFEPIAESVSQVEQLGGLLKKHALTMPTLYVNSTLHDKTKADASVSLVMSIARAAKALGTKVIVTNPSPIRWGGSENKSDAQLREQASNLQALGKALGQEGLTLAYHNHDAELRQGAREFHHMLSGTSAEHVQWCLDAHWIYRGCGDSEVALFDTIERYHERIVELHLRQSRGGVWTEAFHMQGDIDYRRLFDQVDAWGLKPYLVLEQAVEAKSPNTMTAVEAHRQGRDNLSKAL